MQQGLENHIQIARLSQVKQTSYAFLGARPFGGVALDVSLVGRAFAKCPLL